MGPTKLWMQQGSALLMESVTVHKGSSSLWPGDNQTWYLLTPLGDREPALESPHLKNTLCELLRSQVTREPSGLLGGQAVRKCTCEWRGIILLDLELNCLPAFDFQGKKCFFLDLADNG